MTEKQTQEAFVRSWKQELAAMTREQLVKELREAADQFEDDTVTFLLAEAARRMEDKA